MDDVNSEGRGDAESQNTINEGSNDLDMEQSVHQLGETEDGSLNKLFLQIFHLIGQFFLFYQVFLVFGAIVSEGLENVTLLSTLGKVLLKLILENEESEELKAILILNTKGFQCSWDSSELISTPRNDSLIRIRELSDLSFVKDCNHSSKHL